MQQVEQLTPSTMFIPFAVSLIFIPIIAFFRRQCKSEEDTGADLKDMTVVENLASFFQILKNKDREFWFREEVVSQ